MHRGEIILIDDSDVDLSFCLEALNDFSHHYHPVTFQDSDAALEYIRENRTRIFVVVSDMNMPRMTGIELLSSINADHELKMHAIPFIFLSDSKNSAVIESAYAQAAQGYFVKPNKISEFTHIFKIIIEYWSSTKIPRDTVYA